MDEHILWVNLRAEPRLRRNEHRVVLAVWVAAAAMLAATPLLGWPAITRLPAVLLPALIVSAVVLRPWRWTAPRIEALHAWEPSPATVTIGAAVGGAILLWCVLCRFWAGDINAVDFTVYFDRPAFQTLHGRPLFVETSDLPAFAHRSQLAVHAYWIMFPIALLYAVRATPLWLLGLSVVAVVAGAVHVLRIMRLLGTGGVLAVVTALAFALNANTARTLNYGFHPEVLYAWFVPWMLESGLRGRRLPFLLAAFATVLVKEDACMPVFAVSVALALHRWRAMNGADRTVFLVAPMALALINLALYYTIIVPALVAGGAPAYADFWGNYGATPMRALLGMLTHPVRVATDTLASGFFTRVIVPHLFLPLVGWRWAIGITPIVALYGASANDQIKAFGIYYSIVLVPFLVISASSGALIVAVRVIRHPAMARLAAAAAILLGVLIVGGTDAGYVLRPWRPEINAVPAALARLSDERVILVQSGLYPHAGYDARIELLTREALQNPDNTGAIALLAPKISAYPFGAHELDALAQSRTVIDMPDGLIAVRVGDGTLQP